MKAAWAERALWTATAVSLVLGVNGLRGLRPMGSSVSAPAVIPTLVMKLPASDSLLDAAGVVRELDLFRPNRDAVDSAAVAAMPGMPGYMSPSGPSVRPQLILRGLVGGPSLEAIVEGVPGVEGATVLRAGETVAGITLRAVRRDTAILVAKDTTWKLTVRRF